jgi:hypothetical protein
MFSLISLSCNPEEAAIMKNKNLSKIGLRAGTV